MAIAEKFELEASRSATMTTGKIFTKWDETHSELWSHAADPA